MVCLVAALTAVACASLPPHEPSALQFSIPDRGTTRLGRIAAASLPSVAQSSRAKEVSGVRLLPTGYDAFSARLGLARRAEHSIDVQTFLIDDDEVGRRLLRELRNASERGVRVRLLVDDLYAASNDVLLAGLNAYGSVEVRVFNPLPMRVASTTVRIAASLGEFSRVNRRMHNKLLIADGALALVGGRNIADEYFMAGAQSNFIDIDVIAAGRVAGDLAKSFDSYWNSKEAWPLAAFTGGSKSDERRRAFDAHVATAEPQLPKYDSNVLAQTTVEQQLHDGQLELEPVTAQVIADSPDKVLGVDPRRDVSLSELVEVLGRARSDIVVVSPYFVPGPVGMPLLRQVRARGVRVRVYTNSIGSTDEPLVHARYARYRREMLQLGVELFEVSATGARTSRDFGRFGTSVPRLHGKAIWIDGVHVFIGSANMSGRSFVLNTEVGILIESRAIARQLEGLMTQDNAHSLLRVRLEGNSGRLEWVGTDANGTEQVYASEPDSSWWLRLKLWFLGLFVQESWL